MEFIERFGINVYTLSGEELPGMVGLELSNKDPYDQALVGLGALKGWSIMTSGQKVIDEGKIYTKIIDSRL